MIKFFSIALLLFFTGSTAISQSDGREIAQTMTVVPDRLADLQVWAWPLKPGNLRFLVQVYNPSGKPVNISISHANGQTMEDDRIYDKEFARVYNLTELEDGIYNLKVTRGKESIVKKLNIRTETITRRITEVK